MKYRLLEILILPFIILPITVVKSTNDVKCYDWKVGVKELLVFEAILNNNKKQFYSSLDDLNNINIKNVADSIYDIFQQKSVKDEMVKEINTYNIKHVGFLIEDQLFDFDTNGYHRRTYQKKKEDGWDWNYLGKEYHGRTDKSPDDVSKFLENLTKISKDSNQTRDILCFDKVCNNYNLFCHNCQDFVAVCMESVGYANSKIFNSFTIKNKDRLFVRALTHFTKELLEMKKGKSVSYDKIFDIVHHSYNAYKDTNYVKKVKNIYYEKFELFEKSIYNMVCHNMPIMHSLLKIKKLNHVPNQCEVNPNNNNNNNNNNNPLKEDL